DALRAEGLREGAVVDDGDVVHARAAIPVTGVPERRGPLGGDVLNERPAERHVDHLNAATDGQRGETELARREHERDLGLVALTVRRVGGGVARGAEKAR